MGPFPLTAEPDLVGYRRVDVAPFREEMTSAERRKLMAEKFPATSGMDWGQAFDNDIGLLGHLLRDILRLDMADPRQPGRRPNLDEKTATPALDRLLGRDYCDRPYSLLSFGKTLGLLAGKRSLTVLEAKVGISKTRLFRLLRDESVPSMEDMERTAKVFGKSPSFFFEYRVLTIAQAIRDQLVDDPERTVHLYEKLWQSR